MTESMPIENRDRIKRTGTIMTRPTISVVTTSFNSGNHIRLFYTAMRTVLEAIDCTWEVILVDDGSTDDTVPQCRSIAAADPHLTLLELSRKFGKEAALVEGLRNAAGELVFMLDSDLEEPPSTLIRMLEIMRSKETPVDVIYGVCTKRTGGLQHTIGGSLFSYIFNSLSEVKIPIGILPIRLMTRRYLDAVLMHRERALALVGLFVSAGFEQCPLVVEKSYKGYSSYTFSRRLALALRYLIVFSSKPALFINCIGLGTVLLAGLCGVYALGVHFLAEKPLPEWIAMVIPMAFLNGVLLIGVGVCTLYLAYILQEVKQRPVAIVKAVYRAGCLAPAATRIPVLKVGRVPETLSQDTSSRGERAATGNASLARFAPLESR